MSEARLADRRIGDVRAAFATRFGAVVVSGAG